MNQGQHEAASYGVFLQPLCKRNFQNKKCPLEERVQNGNDINPFWTCASVSSPPILCSYGNIKLPEKQQGKCFSWVFFFPAT